MERKDIILGIGVAIGTVVFAVGTIWPFWNAAKMHDSGSYAAAEDWVLHSAPMEQLVGGHRAMEHDWFPKGGEGDGHARYQFKVSGDLLKVDLNVILTESAGRWEVTKAGWHDDAGWHEISLSASPPATSGGASPESPAAAAAPSPPPP